jgi:hypothetical protein
MKKFMSFFEGIYDSLKIVLKTTQWLKVAKITICILVAMLTAFYGAAMLFKEEGVFTVGVLPKKGEDEVAISLSETADFANPVTMLGADGIDQMTNISVNWLPDDLDNVDGSHNGDHYIAYTFYLRNTGNIKCDVTEKFELESAVKGADDAIRVRLYKNGEMTTYAKMGVNGEPEINTVPFEGESLIFSGANEKLDTDQTIKYTLVIWLEGDDPECLDNIKGGNVRMSMTFSAEPFRDEGA